MKVFTLLVAGASLAAAQNFTGQPECAKPCLQDAIAKTCNPVTDIACTCTNSAKIGNDAVACLLSACNSDELVTAQKAGAQVCIDFAEQQKQAAINSLVGAATPTPTPTPTAPPADAVSLPSTTESPTPTPTPSTSGTPAAAAGPSSPPYVNSKPPAAAASSPTPTPTAAKASKASATATPSKAASGANAPAPPSYYSVQGGLCGLFFAAVLAII